MTRVFKNKKILLFILVLFINTYPAYSAQSNIFFDKDLYNKIKHQKEKETYQDKKINTPEIDLSYIKEQKKEKAEKNKGTAKDDIEDSLIHFNLPYQSKLSIAGRKVIGFNYGVVNYKSGNDSDHISAPSDISPGVNMTQEMQVRVHGKVGNKISVNVNYNDKDGSDQRDISVVYKGYKQGEMISDSKYYEQGGYVQKEEFDNAKIGLKTDDIWNELVLRGYVLNDGKITDKFNALPNAAKMGLGTKFRPKRNQIFTVIEKANYIEVNKPVLAKKDDVIQEIAFGDIQLEIPQTEFIGYKKTLFGLRLQAKYEKFNFTAIGSQTKGVVEKKVFKGNTTTDHRKILDTDYLRRKYYKLYFSSSQLPIKKNSEEIYLFDQTSNTVGQTLYEKTAENMTTKARVTYKFKKLISGTDYEIDYVKGIINLKTSIAKNYVIAVDYETSAGNKLSDDNGLIKLLKDENETIKSNQIQEYYSLGNTNIIRGELGKDFIYRIIDVNDSVVSNDYNDIEIDFVNGILKFKKERLFEALYGYGNSFYDDDTIASKYRIEVEYSYEKADNFSYTIGKTIVSGSENILLDGKKLEKDRDYIIDYDIGIITLINSDALSSSSSLEITYEYIPYGGQYQQTLLGARAEYQFYDDSYLGVSTIYSGASKPATAPSVYSPPKSITVVDSDLNIKLKKDNTILPFDMTIKGEIATSIQNPNIFGVALVENMESSDNADTPSLNYESWQIASNPNGKAVRSTDTYKLSNEDIDVRQINENLKKTLDTERKVQVLKMDYANLPNNEQNSIVYVLGKGGVDYSEKKFLEVWIYADEVSKQNKPSIYFKYGGIDEDADGRLGFEKDTGVWKKGDPKTEDLNGDGKLSVGEDIGWDYYPKDSTAPVRIGANNGKLDFEDLNGNGILDKDDLLGGSYGDVLFRPLGNSYLIDEAGEKHDSVDWSGWKKFVIPLNIAANGGKGNWETIKNLRITIENKQSSSNITGILKFYDIAAVGNKWTNLAVLPSSSSAAGFEVKAVSKETDSDYISIADDARTKGEYEKLYPSVRDTKNLTEESIALIYEGLQVNATGYVSYTLTNDKKYDFSTYKKLKFFLYGDGNNAEFFINFGADENNYFEYKSTITWSGWDIPEIDLADNKNLQGENISDGVPDGFTSYKGTPRLNNIKYIRIGLRNKNTSSISGKIFVNDIYVEGVIKKEGTAYKGEVIFNLPKSITLKGNAKHIDSDFETITTGSQSDLSSSNSITSGQQIDSYGGGLDVNTFRFMPISVEVTKDIKTTPKSYSTVFSIQEEGKVESETKSIGTTFNIAKLPQIKLSYSNGNANFYDLNISSSNIYILDEKQNKDIYYGRTEYKIPVTTRFYEQKIYGDYKYEKLKHDYYDLSESTTTLALEELKEEYSFGTDLMLLNRLTVKPKYSYANITNLKNNKIEYDRYFKKRQEKAGMTSEIVIFNWLRPNAEYNAVKTEDFNVVETSTFTTKDISMENNGNVNVDIYLKSIFPKFEPTKSMNLNARYEIKDVNTWDDVDKNYDFMNKWTTRSFDGLVTNDNYFSNPDTGTQASFLQEDTKSGSIKYNPFEFIKLDGKWFVPVNSISTRFSYRNTYSDNLTNDVDTKVWPEVLTDIKNIENILFLSRFISNGEMTIKYSDKKEFSFEVYDKLTTDFDSKYRFKLLKKFDCSLNYKINRYTEFDLDKDVAEANRKVKDVENNAYGIQVGYTYKIWRFTTRYDKSEKDEELINTDLKWTDEQSLSLKSDVDFNSKNGIKIPFKKERIKVENRIRMSSEIKGTQKRSDVLEDNKDIYDLILSSEYNLNSNFQIKLGGKVSDVRFTLQDKSSYTAFLLTTEVSIVF